MIAALMLIRIHLHELLTILPSISITVIINVSIIIISNIIIRYLRRMYGSALCDAFLAKKYLFKLAGGII